MSRTMVLIGGLILVVAGVFVFRGLWMLLAQWLFLIPRAHSSRDHVMRKLIASECSNSR